MINKRRTAIGLTAALALLAMGAIVAAQGPGAHGGFRGRGPGGRGGGAGFVPPIPNAPFSGTVVRSFTENLAGGNSISRSSCAKVYRSSTGATRIEETRDSAACSSTPSFISITDPVAGMRYEINVAKSTYFEMKLRPRPNSTTPPSGAPPDGHRGPNGDQVQKTPLGTQPISGTSLSAEGTQFTFTIPAGKVGNAQPITVTSTRWYSPDLHIVVQSSSSDPRGGNSTEQMSNISIAEPAASLFQLPSGLTLETRHFERRGPQGPPPPQQ
jgi:hypothetical protein